MWNWSDAPWAWPISLEMFREDVFRKGAKTLTAVRTDEAAGSIYVHFVTLISDATVAIPFPLKNPHMSMILAALRDHELLSLN